MGIYEGMGYGVVARARACDKSDTGVDTGPRTPRSIVCVTGATADDRKPPQHCSRPVTHYLADTSDLTLQSSESPSWKGKSFLFSAGSSPRLRLSTTSATLWYVMCHYLFSVDPGSIPNRVSSGLWSTIDHMLLYKLCCLIWVQ